MEWHGVCNSDQCYWQKSNHYEVHRSWKENAVRECKVLCQKFRTQTVIASSPNGWLNTELTLQWIGAFSFKQRLLALDSYKCHIEGTAKKLLATKKIDTAIVPGGCTKYAQVPDVSWHQIFKAKCTERYDHRLATEGINNGTEADNLKSPPQIKWILDAWVAFPSEMIKKLFIHCSSDWRITWRPYSLLQRMTTVLSMSWSVEFATYDSARWRKPFYQSCQLTRTLVFCK